MAFPELLQLLGQFGVPIALVIFFVIQNRDREKRMADRLDRVEDFVRLEFAEIVEKTTIVISENTRVMQHLEHWLDRSDSRITSGDIHHSDRPKKPGTREKP